MDGPIVKSVGTLVQAGFQYVLPTLAQSTGPKLLAIPPKGGRFSALVRSSVLQWIDLIDY